MNFATISLYVSYTIYALLGLIALWGTFCVIMVWRRVAETRFRSEQEQDEFLAAVEQLIVKNDVQNLQAVCDSDPRVMPQLTLLAVQNRKLGFTKIRSLLAERFQRDVLAELDYRLSWVRTVIKSAPMVGLLGTVVGMMGAFNTLSIGEPNAEDLAADIMLALITTACGLSIAIPLVLAMAAVNVRIGKMEDLVGSGLNRLLESFRSPSS